MIALTGQRYLDGYSSDEAQFKALMDQGITFGKQYALQSGVALTPEQMALLTGDIVWLVNTTVKMPDGSLQSVLVPQVYAKVKPGDIDGSGALLAGNHVNIRLDGDLFNSGTLNGRRVLQLEAGNITNRAGTLLGDDVRLNARNIATQMYGKPASELDETQKQTISTLATLAAGLAGGLAGDSSASAVSGAQAGKTTVENNYLSSKESRQLDKEMQDCKASGGDCNKVVEKYIEISNKNSKELQEACTGGGVTCVSWEELIQGAKNVANNANPSQIRLDEKLKDPSAAALVNYLNGADLKFLKDNITTGDRVMSVVMDPTSWPVAIMGGKAIITNAVNNTKEQLIAVGVGAGVGAGIQYGTTGKVSLSDLIGSCVIGAITAGKGYNPTMAWNAAGGYYQAEISGNDPFMAALLSKAGASAGYAAGNIIKVPMDKILNPVSKQHEWVPTGVWTITKPAPQSSIPSITGNLGDNFVSGVTGDALQKAVSGDKK